MNWVSPTSNIVEKLFSKAKNVKSALRNRILLFHFEKNLYLAVNQKYWNIDTLSSVFDLIDISEICSSKFFFKFVFVDDIYDQFGHYL